MEWLTNNISLRLVVSLVAILSGCSTPKHYVSPTMGATLDTGMQIAKIAGEYDGKTICTNRATIGSIADALAEYSKAHPEKGGEFSDEDLYLFLFSHYPCH